MSCVQLNRRICPGVNGVGSASLDFRTPGAEIGRTSNSPTTGWLFLDFVIGDDGISKTAGDEAEGNSVISDDGIESASCG